MNHNGIKRAAVAHEASHGVGGSHHESQPRKPSRVHFEADSGLEPHDKGPRYRFGVDTTLRFGDRRFHICFSLLRGLSRSG